MEESGESIFSRSVRGEATVGESEKLKKGLKQRRYNNNNKSKPTINACQNKAANWLESIISGCTKPEKCVFDDEEQEMGMASGGCLPRVLRRSSSPPFSGRGVAGGYMNWNNPSNGGGGVGGDILPPTGTIFATNSDQSTIKRRQKQVDKLHNAKIKGDKNVGRSSSTLSWRQQQQAEEEAGNTEDEEDVFSRFDDKTTVVTTTEAIHSLGIIQPSMSGLSDDSVSMSPSLKQGRMPHIPTLEKMYQGLRVANSFERIFRQIRVTVPRVSNGDGMGGDCEETVHHHFQTKEERARVTATWQNCWSEPHAMNFRCRAENYLGSGLKTASRSSLFGVVGVDSFKSDKPVHSIMERPHSFLQRFREAVMQMNASREARRDTILRVPFLLAFNFVLPWGSLVIYCTRPSAPVNKESPAEMLWEKFLRTEHGDFRRSRLKMIPSVGKGPWVVKKLVGGKPAIIGHKVPVTFHGNKRLNFLEVEIDVSGGGTFANSIAHSVMGKSEDVTVDLAFVIEGQNEEELPEKLLAVVRLHELRMGLAPTITEWDETNAARGPAWKDDDSRGNGAGRILPGNSYLIDI
ncbi:hypothetical protein TrLO_g5426 [Triparma laevis f. longispina]|uniref:Protein ENHANCED DISEASE RESISTANCE 2 C-terminal domain-containing protein n=2 Tax=Triparma laevis TaxID=1534972 RepID=A0A9W6ZNE5_9STRA|nr:hypothetical protein TrLO_g5426 [Triparma laevis f. longispina]